MINYTYILIALLLLLTSIIGIIILYRKINGNKILAKEILHYRIPECKYCTHKDICSPYRRIKAVLLIELFLTAHNDIYKAISRGCTMYRPNSIVNQKNHKKTDLS